jgi:uncharacterized membrane protein
MAGEPDTPEPSPSPSSSPTAGAPSAKPRWRVIWQRYHLSLAILVVGFAVGYFLATLLRYEEFYGTNWDLGINMQVLWSTTHGRVLYDAGDFETGGLRSILSLHSVYVAIPLAYVYALAPGAATLLAIQAAVLASSAIPLYLIGKKAGLPEVWRLGGIAALLLTFTVISALMYDFHWEAFLPAEFAWTYYLWNERRYLLAFVPAVLGVLTLEVFPFLLLGLVVYFGYTSLRYLAAKPTFFAQELRRNLRGAWPLVALTLFAVLSYAVIRYVQHNVVPGWVGSPALTTNTQVTLTLNQLFQITATSQTIPGSLVYWFLLLAACGFLPLLFRQSLLLLSFPWFWATVLIDPRFSSWFGDQYAFVAMATLSVAFVEGLATFYWAAHEENAVVPLPVKWMVAVIPFFIVAWLYSTDLLAATSQAVSLLEDVATVVAGVFVWIWVSRHLVRPRSTRPATDVTTTPGPGGSRARRGWRSLTRFQTRSVPVLAGVLAVVIAANLVMSPLNPTNFNATPYPGYKFSYSGNPSYQYIGQVVAQIPSNAVVVASDILFPFVANNVNAYSLAWALPVAVPDLPFNSTNLPPYVLLSSSEWGPVPSFLKTTVFDTSDYGILSVIYSADYPGTIYLFMAGYRGGTTMFEATPFPNNIFLCPSSLSLGPSGSVAPAAGTPCGSEVASVPAANLSGNGHTVWYGPYITLLPGLYNVTMSVEGGINQGMPATASILYVNGNGYGMSTTWYSFHLNAATLRPNQWVNVTVHLNLTAPVSGVEFRGYLDYSNAIKPPKATGFVDLSWIDIVRLCPSM